MHICIVQLNSLIALTVSESYDQLMHVILFLVICILYIHPIIFLYNQICIESYTVKKKHDILDFELFMSQGIGAEFKL